MAELSPASAPWTSGNTHGQWMAVATLRWQMFRNGLFRHRGGGELVAALVLYPLLSALFLVPTIGAGAGAFYLAGSGRLGRLPLLLWGIFLLAQFANINLGQPGTTFDPTQLIRFPLPLRQFVLLRLFFGVLSPANVLVFFMGCAVAFGLSVAVPRLWFFASIAMLVFIAVNVLFSRMVFAWVDRWLSTRRAREVFTALIFIASLAFQYVNVAFNSDSARGHSHHANLQRWSTAGHLYQRAQPWLAALPPDLTAHALQSAEHGRPMIFSLSVAACAGYGALFLAIFALRMRTEFRGESLSDRAFGGSASIQPRARSATLAPAAAVSSMRSSLSSSGWLSDPVRAVLAKELLYTRRNVGIFYSLIAPLAMVFLFAGRLATRNSSPWILPAALAYTLIGIVPLSYNSFGLEGTGSQMYFLAPVRLRDVVFAKNLMGFGLAALEAVATVIIFAIVLGKPSFSIMLPGLFWAAATLLVNTSVGNLRSLAAPKQIKLAKLSGKQASPLSALLSLGILLVFAAAGACVLIAGRAFHLPWLAGVTFSMLFIAALAIYFASLRRVDGYALAHREQLFAELCKT